MPLKKYLTLPLAVIIMFSILSGGTVTLFAAQSQARAISFFKLEGDDIKMTKGTVREFNAKVGFRLYDGYTVSTGLDSYSYFNLDDSSIIKMDQRSEIKVSKASSSKLSITVESGAALVDAEKQDGDKSLETRIGNTAIAVRGTLYVVEYEPGLALYVTMLDGSGDIGGNSLSAGQVMRVSDEKRTNNNHFHIQPFRINKEVSLFTLLAVSEYRELLLANGVISEDDIALLEELIAEKKAEREWENAKIARAEIAAANNKKVEYAFGSERQQSVHNIPYVPELGPSDRPVGMTPVQPRPPVQPIPNPQYPTRTSGYTVTYSLNGGRGNIPTESNHAAGQTFTAAWANGLVGPYSDYYTSGNDYYGNGIWHYYNDYYNHYGNADNDYSEKDIIRLRDYKVFTEWNTMPDGSGISYTQGQTITMPAYNLVLYAIWGNWSRDNNATYKVTYYFNERFLAEAYVIAGESYRLENRGEERFFIWNTKPDGTGESYEQGQIIKMPPRDLILYLVRIN